MKLTRKWQGNKPTHKPKRVGHKPKIPLQLLGLPSPKEEQPSNSMDEVRRQADGAEYVAICLPAFSPDTVHRDSE